MPNFPPQVYYRDTYGFDDNHTESDNDSITTKSTVTVRTTYNINPMGGGGMAINPTYQHIHNRNTTMDSSKFINFSNSYHVEQLVTSKILTPNPRTMLILTLIAFASALQLLIFSIIAVFYDGPIPYALLISVLLICNSLVVLAFTKFRPTRAWLFTSLIAAAFSFVESVGLFFWTAMLINDEEKYIESVGANDNRIVTSTRIAMYSFQMVFTPIHTIASALIIFVLRKQLTSRDETVNGYFLSEPELGHQKILVPIELRQIRDMTDDEDDNVSIGVQTGGSRNN
ncbi:unnamed protein product [Caenorhabditis bovis]|uniref:Transmembrane protein n=1 Tax=Caenorhabditis bovis TaxID=2654633 RepID=A0A8S1E965_9PELO|nr:unnamed protein product [Caenorhabditis bovis]